MAVDPCYHQLQGVIGLCPARMAEVFTIISPCIKVFHEELGLVPGLQRFLSVQECIHFFSIETILLGLQGPLTPDGHRILPGGHRAWLSPDGGSGGESLPAHWFSGPDSAQGREEQGGWTLCFLF